jgi:hypothetical protein
MHSSNGFICWHNRTLWFSIHSELFSLGKVNLQPSYLLRFIAQIIEFTLHACLTMGKQADVISIIQILKCFCKFLAHASSFTIQAGSQDLIQGPASPVVNHLPWHIHWHARLNTEMNFPRGSTIGCCCRLHKYSTNLSLNLWGKGAIC